jgi:hypothetical protein
MSWAWYCTPVFPSGERLRQEEDLKFKASLGYIARPYLPPPKKGG